MAKKMTNAKQAAMYFARKRAKGRAAVPPPQPKKATPKKSSK